MTGRNLEMMVGRTARMLKAGYTPEEISIALKHPIEEVMEWIAIVEEADLNRKKTEE